MSARLTLLHDGKPFLERWGWECKWFGVFVHHVIGPDPGMDMHDHPWPFVSLRIAGGYTERIADIRAPYWVGTFDQGKSRVHTRPLRRLHQIVSVQPHTWTLVIRGTQSKTDLPKPWGFYEEDQRRWVPHDDYNYSERRPVFEERYAAS